MPPAPGVGASTGAGGELIVHDDAAPAEPAGLDDLVRRTVTVERIATGLVAVLLLIVPVLLGVVAVTEGSPVLGAVILALVAAIAAAIVGTSWRRYGRRGERWVARLREAASRAGPPRAVEVWFVVPGPKEGRRSQRMALVGEPGGRPDHASKLLVEVGAGQEPGAALAWGTGRGDPMLLEVAGQPLWPARPAKGRAEVARFLVAAAMPNSTLTLRRPHRRVGRT